MYSLYLLRHGLYARDSSGASDPPLSDTGRHDVRRVGDFMKANGMRPELILCSAAQRAVESAEAVLVRLESGVEVEADPQLTTADAPGVLRRLHAIDDAIASVLFVGHNPTIHHLAVMLCGKGDRDLRVRLNRDYAAGALTALRIAAPSWAALAENMAEITAFVTPEDLS